MTINERSEIDRALGYLEGVALIVEDDKVRTAIFDALERIENALAGEFNKLREQCKVGE